MQSAKCAAFVGGTHDFVLHRVGLAQCLQQARDCNMAIVHSVEVQSPPVKAGKTALTPKPREYSDTDL